MCSTQMLFHVISVISLHTVYATEMTYFRRATERDGLSCLDTDILLDETEDRLVLGDCLARCAWNPICTSVFYAESSRKCFGCGVNYGDLAGLPIVAGTIGYAKKAKYMDKCESDLDCPLPNMGCDRKLCICLPGFPYSPSTESCVTSCATYGDTFQTFWFAKLTSTPRETNTNCFTHINLNPKKCKDYCASQSWCLSFDHSPAICKCRYHEHTKATKPTKWLRVLTVYGHYQRNCA